MEVLGSVDLKVSNILSNGQWQSGTATISLIDEVKQIITYQGKIDNRYLLDDAKGSYNFKSAIYLIKPHNNMVSWHKFIHDKIHNPKMLINCVELCCLLLLGLLCFPYFSIKPFLLAKWLPLPHEIKFPLYQLYQDSC